jgi:hypothetical protein
MIHQIHSQILNLKKIIESWDIKRLKKQFLDFKQFLDNNKDNYYSYLDTLNKSKEFNLDKVRNIEEFSKIFSLYMWRFEPLYNYEEAHIADIYEWLSYILDLFDYFKKSPDNYNIFWEIYFELYEHLLPNHINELLKKL